MHVAGIVVRTRPEHAQLVSDVIGKIRGAEVHAIGEHGRIAVVLEAAERGEIADTLYRLNALEHVLSSAMVYEESDNQSQYQGVEQ